MFTLASNRARVFTAAFILGVTWWHFYFDGRSPFQLTEGLAYISTSATYSKINITANFSGPEISQSLSHSQPVLVETAKAFSDHFEPSMPTESSPPNLHGESAPKEVSASSAAPYARATPVILYAYSPSPWAFRNLQFFLVHGLHASATFLFIFNGALDTDLSPASDLDESLESALALLEPFRQQYSNIRTIKRPNTCFDLGAYGEVLLADNFTIYRAHERFILMNPSIRGPFIPFWSRECWSEAYLRQLDELDHENRRVKLVGMTFNCWSPSEPGHRHVQSMLLATDKVGMSVLLGKNTTMHLGDSAGDDSASSTKGLTHCAADYQEAVSIEMSLTPLIMSHNYSVRTMMALSHSSPHYTTNCTNQDVNQAPGAYEGGNLSVWESMFVKTNRPGVNQAELEKVTEWMDKAVENEEGVRRGSWDSCGST